MSQNQQKETAAEKAKREDAAREADKVKQESAEQKAEREAKELAEMEEAEKRDKALAEKRAKQKRFPFQVAQGRAVCGTAKGMLVGGDEIRAEWLNGGEKALTRLVDKGVVDAH